MRFFALLFGALFCALPLRAEVVFKIGKPDARAGEFRIFRNLGDDRHAYTEGFPEAHRPFRDVDGCREFFKKPVEFVVGKSKDSDFPFIHPFHNCAWAGVEAPVYKIFFDTPGAAPSAGTPAKYYLKVGFSDSSNYAWHSLKISVNGKVVGEARRLYTEYYPWAKGDASRLRCAASLAYYPHSRGVPSRPHSFAIDASLLKRDGSKNCIELTPVFDPKYKGQLWLTYDFIELSSNPEYPKIPDWRGELLDRAIAAMGTEEVVFCASGNGRDWHWYANFGKTVEPSSGDAETDRLFGKEVFSRLGCKLVVYNLRTGEHRYLIDDPKGSLRDPQVSFDGKKILFSYRKGDSDLFHIYEIGVDGKNLTKLPFAGDWNDIEPCYLPNGDILYCSDRLRRTVQCWYVPVSNLHRWFRDENVTRCITVNPDVDNRPRLLSDGRIIYMRWDYNHRNQLGYHNLWTIQPDGSGEMIFLGNEKPGGLYIGAEQIPDENGVVFTLAPGHGIKDHRGAVARAVAPFDPSDPYAFEIVSGQGCRYFMDPYPIGDGLMLVSGSDKPHIMDFSGQAYCDFKMPADLLKTDAEVYYNVSMKNPPKCEMIVRNVQPLAPRKAPPQRADSADFSQKTATVFIQDIYEGRKMASVKRGTIKKLMVVRMLPEPVHFHGGFHPLGVWAGFALERILGTVPVYEDGSASFEVPSQEALAFVALDENGNCVKRMQSFVGFAPATSTSCIGCHERRTEAPIRKIAKPMAYGKVSKIEPIAAVPPIIDYSRHVQPIFDRYCLACHSYEKRRGGVVLEWDLNPRFIQSYMTLLARGQLSTGFNAWGNREPYSFGSGGSALMGKIGGGHHGVKLDADSLNILRAWLDTGAMQVGTYAAAGTGFMREYFDNKTFDRAAGMSAEREAINSVVRERCIKCHSAGNSRPFAFSFEYGGFRAPDGKGGFKLSGSRGISLYNLTRPEKSLVLLLPLSKSAGGLADSSDKSSHPEVFKDKSDAGYAKMLSAVSAVADYLKKTSPFHTSPDFRPSRAYIRQMQACGILPKDWKDETHLDPMSIDERYFKWQDENVSHAFGKN